MEWRVTRRVFFSRAKAGNGTAALPLIGDGAAVDTGAGSLVGIPHFTPKAKRMIILHRLLAAVERIDKRNRQNGIRDLVQAS